MSMFHELMMRKKEEIMYATIKGSLTENDGVFSGFSTSNYLKTQQVFSPQDKSWEMVFRFTINSVSGDKSIVSLAGNNAFSLFQNNSAIQVFISSNGTSWNIVNSIIFYATANTTYTVKIKFTGNEYIIYSLENNEWVVKETVSSSAQIYGGLPFAFGVARTYANPFSGSIDLNNSYIKLGSTKYNLQAVVGYTIVGRPTITDGVASGFSASDYLTFPTILSKYSSDDINRVEMGIKITTGNSVGLSGLIVNSNYYYNGLLIGGNTKPSFYFNLGGVDNAVSDVVLQPNTEYTIIGILDKKTNSIKISVNGIVNTNTANYFTFSNNQATGIGYGYRTGAFEGSIDLKSTYIKVNNKLYFNGQQA